MKKFYKICLITGSICVLLGLGITTAGAAMGGTLQGLNYGGYNLWGSRFPLYVIDRVRERVFHGYNNRYDYYTDYDDFDVFDDYNDYNFDYDYNFDVKNTPIYHYDDDLFERDVLADMPDNSFKKTFSASQANKLDLEVRWGKVIILESSQPDQITVTSNVEDSYIECYSDNGKLKIKAKPANTSDTVTFVEIPKGHIFQEADIELKASNKRTTFEGNTGPEVIVEAISAGELDIDAKVGGIGIQAGNVSKLDINCDVGAVDYAGTVSGDIEADCKVGAVNLELAGHETDFNYEVDCKVGAVTVGSRSFAGLSGKNRINNGASKKADLDCDVGALTVTFVN
jgi:hypothetical protein